MPSTDFKAFRLDKRQVRWAFERAAETYDQVADFQRTVGHRLLAHLDPVRIKPSVVVDLGAGTGACLRPLEKRYRDARIVAVDLAETMLRRARRKAPWLYHRQRYVCADAEELPLADASVHLLFSNLALQWCNDPDRMFRELVRVLAPGGLVVFSTLGPDTLKELRASWFEADGFNHVNAFTDMHDLGDALVRSGLKDVVVDAERFVRTYEDVFALMRDLKALGAHNVTAGRQKGLTGKRQLQGMARAYERYRVNGLLPASYEVVYAHAWKFAPRPAEVSIDALRAGPIPGNVPPGGPSGV